MANLIETPRWEDGIYQIETSDPVLGGPGGIANKQAEQLGNRTAFLKEQIESAESDLTEHIAAEDPHPQYTKKTEFEALATVAKSGNYADLNGAPEIMTGATSESSGTSGMVPPPEAGDENKVLTGSGEWKHLSGIAIGQEVMHYGSTPPPGCLICNGSEVSRATYSDLFSVIGTTYGEGDCETTFNLPNRIGRFGQGSLTPGQYIEAGLPDAGGFTGLRGTQGSGNIPDGIFYKDGIKRTLGQYNGDITDTNGLSVKLSLGNPIFGKSETVQPPALTQLPCIKAFDAFINPGLIDITELANEIAGKIDKVVNGKPIRYILDTYNDGTNWWRKWSDGWIEQGGQFLSAVGVGAMSVVNLHFPTGVVYFVWSMASIATDGTASAGGYTQPDTTKINFYQGWAGQGIPIKWYACGIGAE